jgi:hypothetical protein
LEQLGNNWVQSPIFNNLILVAGSRLSFAELGTHELKGIPGEWQVCQVA